MSNSKEERIPLVQRDVKRVLLADLLSGLTTAFSVTPFVTIIDQAVIQNANGSVPLWKSVGNGIVDLVKKPVTFMQRAEFWWVYFVYSLTYPTANMTESWCKSRDINPVYPQFWASFIVNCSASIIRDRALTRLFGQVSDKQFPMQSYGCFFARDVMIIWFIFSMPEIFGKKLSEKFGWNVGDSIQIAQMICPISIQLFATPFHLLGLDYYNNEKNTLNQRLQFLKQEAGKSILIRMIRFLPAYSIGGVLNIVLREKFSSALDY